MHKGFGKPISDSTRMMLGMKPKKKKKVGGPKPRGLKKRAKKKKVKKPKKKTDPTRKK